MTARKTSVGGFSGELVSRVALTGEPISFRGWKLTVENLIRRTTSADWIHNYMRLKPDVADRIAAKIRAEMPWLGPFVLVGEVMPRIETPGEVRHRLGDRRLQLVSDVAQRCNDSWNSAVTEISQRITSAGGRYH